MSTVSSPSGSSFVRKHARVVAGVASAGVLAGLSLVAATPAMGATDADCTLGNTVDASTKTAADIQTLLSDVTVPVVCLSGTFVLTDTLVYDHSLTIYGLADAVLDGNGAVQILSDDSFNSELTVENLRLTRGNGSNGAAIEAKNVVVHNSVFDNNQGNLGSVYADNATVDGSAFTANSAFFGGALFADTVATVTDSTFTSNSADTAGGAIVSYGSTTVNSSTFVDNSAGNAGGAIATQYGVAVTNSTFVRNSTENEGAGGAINFGSGSVVQSTFIDNSSTGGAGESIYASVNEAPASLQGNIFASDGTLPQIGGQGTVDDLGANIFSTLVTGEPSLATPQATSAFGVTSAELFNLATLADNGGATQTVALYAGSPAVNFVPASLATVTVDQRGVDRDALSDAGAYEYVPEPEPIVSAALPATGLDSTVAVGGFAALLLALGGLAVGIARRPRARQQ